MALRPAFPCPGYVLADNGKTVPCPEKAIVAAAPARYQWTRCKKCSNRHRREQATKWYREHKGVKNPLELAKRLGKKPFKCPGYVDYQGNAVPCPNDALVPLTSPNRKRCTECAHLTKHVSTMKYQRQRRALEGQKAGRVGKPMVPPEQHLSRKGLIRRALNEVPCILIHKAAGCPNAGLFSDVPGMLSKLSDEQILELLGSKGKECVA